MLQCAAVCCSVLQCVAVCCSVLQLQTHVCYTRESALDTRESATITHKCVIECVAVSLTHFYVPSGIFASLLSCFAVCCGVLQWFALCRRVV